MLFINIVAAITVENVVRWFRHFHLWCLSTLLSRSNAVRAAQDPMRRGGLGPEPGENDYDGEGPPETTPIVLEESLKREELEMTDDESDKYQNVCLRISRISSLLCVVEYLLDYCDL